MSVLCTQKFTHYGVIRNNVSKESFLFFFITAARKTKYYIDYIPGYQINIYRSQTFSNNMISDTQEVQLIASSLDYFRKKYLFRNNFFYY